MSDFFTAIIDNTLFRNAVYAGLLSSLACGITGTFVVIKRITYISGGIAHAVMGGLGIAYFFGINPIYGAIAFAIFAALLIAIIKLKFHQNIDILINALWAVGMAIGVIFVTLTPGYNISLQSFLFGNIMLVKTVSLRVMLGLDVVIVTVVFLLYRQLIYVSFDEEYAALRGVNVSAINIILLCIIALTVVILIQVVGLILVIALLSLPAAIAHILSSSPWRMMLLSTLLSLLFIFSGFIVSYYLTIPPNLKLPAGATIIMITALVYLLVLTVNRISMHYRKIRSIDSHTGHLPRKSNKPNKT